MESTATNELAIPEAAPASSITALAMPADRMQATIEAVAEGLDGPMTERDLLAIQFPQGTSKILSFVTSTGEHDVKNLECVIIHKHATRSYWPGSVEEADGSPPMCASDDGETGVGDPGGLCATCPLGQRSGSDRSPCKPFMQTLILTEHGALPMALRLPAGSFKAWKEYVMRSATSGMAYWKQLVSLSLETLTKKGSTQQYPAIVIDIVRPLTDAEIASVQSYRDAIGVNKPTAQQDFRRTERKE